jgi:predicted anti-sigma-YlaC factor YlaD
VVARRHLDAALALSGGKKLGVQLAWAEVVLVQQQDRAAFEAELRRILAFDVDSAPEHRLANLVAQRRARALLAHVDDLFA